MSSHLSSDTVSTIAILAFFSTSFLLPKKKNIEPKIQFKKQIAAFGAGMAVLAVIGGIGFSIYWIFTTPMSVSLPTTIGGWMVLFWLITPSRRSGY